MATMRLDWNFQRGGGFRPKTICGRGRYIFWFGKRVDNIINGLLNITVQVTVFLMFNKIIIVIILFLLDLFDVPFLFVCTQIIHHNSKVRKI